MSNQQRLVEAFAPHFLKGGSFLTIVEARSHAESILGEKVSPGTVLAKLVEESLEASVVRAARITVRQSDNPQQAYNQLVGLYYRQPTLGTRSSTSVLQQAYSTPIPIAYLAATLAQITPQTTVYEPTAGHGALLICADPFRVTVNELNRERAADLREQGFTVTEHEASVYLPNQQHDVVILNPPFGSVPDGNGKNQRFNLGRYSTTQIDHAIALQSLGAMKPEGRAVLILGGKLGTDEDERSKRYNTQETRAFYYTLYDQYNVTDHISIQGDLYRKQGAGFPIDLILIEGQGKSPRPLPAAQVPLIYKSFDELGVLLDEFLLHKSQRLESARSREAISRSRPRERDTVDPESLPRVTEPSRQLVDRALDGRPRSDPRTDAADVSQDAGRLGTESEPSLVEGARGGTPPSGNLESRVGQDTGGRQRDSENATVSNVRQLSPQILQC